MGRISALRLAAIMLLGFALTLTSNVLDPAVFSHKTRELAPQSPNTALGFTTFAGLLVAVVVQPVVGTLSDRTRTRWGRRLPYFVGGAGLAGLCLYLIALAPSLWVLVAGVLLLQLAANVIQGPWQALIPDQVPEALRGRAAGLKATFDILALVIGRQVGGQLLGRFPEWGNSALLAAVSVPVVVFGAALGLVAWAARDPAVLPARPAAPAARATPRSPAAAIRRMFTVDLRAYPAFGWWFANRLLFWAAFIALSTFLVNYMQDVAGMPAAEAQPFVGNVSTLLGLALLVVTLPAGWLADRLGRAPIVAAAGLTAAAGAGLIVLAGANVGGITAGAVVVGLGVGFFLSANWALVTDLVPAQEAARYLGIANIATAGGSALARFLGGALIDPLNQALGSSAAGYLILYGLAAGFFLLSAVMMGPLWKRQVGMTKDE